MHHILHVTALAVAALSLAACTPPAGIDPVPVASTASVDRLQARYDAARPYADMLLPYLSEARAARLRFVLSGIERALVVARTAATLVEQRAALASAERAILAVEKQPSG
ncbi:hypothetical protein [Sphingomonas sp. Leaf4]|uniref:hypothetical protein n=1 Tax=Sphingomonas sp. Leaf4 TaxID=2876553 RepID=UPI001E61BFC2|nr:hypothetical protein [Sphingomonas sp. Leaf4]